MVGNKHCTIDYDAIGEIDQPARELAIARWRQSSHPLIRICRFLVLWDIPRLGIVQVSQPRRCFLLVRSQELGDRTTFGKDLRLTYAISHSDKLRNLHIR